MIYGHTFEPVAAKKFEESTRFKVERCGFFVHYEHGFIGASPDYLVIMPCGKRALLEIKCPETAKNMEIGEWIKNRKEAKADCCMEVGKNGLINLKRDHNYIYHVQCQLECAQLDTCFFRIFTQKDLPAVQLRRHFSASPMFGIQLVIRTGLLDPLIYEKMSNIFRSSVHLLMFPVVYFQAVKYGRTH